MSSRIRRILLLLVLFLICSQAFGSETSPPVPRRQKRGIMKMMMHIMWDPVRLIRYWYAYDVTKEIAKSWRKILPTMMLLPFNPNAANTPGIAKYVHPTTHAKHHKNAKQFAYPAAASGETYSASQFSKNYFLTDPSSKDTYSQFPSNAGLIFERPRKPTGSESATNLDSVPAVFQQYGGPQGGDGNIYMSSFPVMADGGSNEDQHQAMFHPLSKDFPNIYHHGQVMGPSKNQPGIFSGEHSDMKPFPYIIGIPHTSREEVIFKASSGEAPVFSEEKRDSDTVPSPTNTDNTRTKTSYLKFSSEPAGDHPGYAQFQPGVKSYMDYEGDQKDGQRPIPHVVHAGHQELHIVLHPIPIGDTNLPPQATDGKALHFVPVDLSSNKSAISQLPFLFPTAAQNSDPDGSHERQNSAPPDDDEEFYPSNNSSGKARTERVKNERHHSRKKVDKTSSSSEISDSRQSTRVTWVLKPSRRKDTKYFDNDPEGSIPRISSVNFNKDESDGELQDKHPLLLNGQSIDLVQLKEDLRHGTPVLIPFNKRTDFSPKSNENPVEFAEINNYDRFSKGKERKRIKSTEKEEISAERPQTYSLEQYDAYDEKNSTQRFILFLKRQPPYNHGEN